jgi:hypothetical protein
MPDPTIWASGYQQDELEQLGASVHDRRKLKHIGGAVLFSACWLALTGGVAAWGLADQLDTTSRAVAAASAALVMAA